MIEEDIDFMIDRISSTLADIDVHEFLAILGERIREEEMVRLVAL